MSPSDYRQHATRCMAVGDLTGGSLMQRMIVMAAAWLRLAEQAERNRAADLGSVDKIY